MDILIFILNLYTPQANPFHAIDAGACKNTRRRSPPSPRLPICYSRIDRFCKARKSCKTAPSGATMIAAYLQSPPQDGDPGTTTVAALMLCYGLGVMVWHDEIQLAVMLGIVATMLLYFKPELRGWSQRMSRHDLLSVLQFAVLALISLPLVPRRNYGPYGALNP